LALFGHTQEPERKVITSGLRRVLRTHDAALRSVWQYYVSLDLQLLLEDDSALESDRALPTDASELMLLVAATALEGGRLHTRQVILPC
jgi:hypothetical protein